MMKWISVFALMGLSTTMMAQQYYSPNPRDLEPQARFQLETVTSTAEELTYILPEELTGDKLKIQLKEVEVTDLGRIYRGDKATAQCMGKIDEQVCVVVHRDLFANQKAAEEAQTKAASTISANYQDPTLQENALKISADFLDPFTNPDGEHAGINQPLGIVSAKSMGANPISGRYSGVYLVRNSSGELTAQEHWFELSSNVDKNSSIAYYRKGSYTKIGYLENIKIRNNRLSATWRGSSSRSANGWIEFTFDDDRKEFSGSWGLIEKDMDGVLKNTDKINIWFGTRN